MSRRMQSGFNLVELLTAVVIVAILATLIIPSYQESVRKARRSDSQAVMLELAQWMERFYTENGRYDQDRAGVAVNASIPLLLQSSPKEGTVNYYTLAVGNLAPQTFTITATAIGDQAGDKCGNLTLTETGTKGMTATGLNVNQCW